MEYLIVLCVAGVLNVVRVREIMASSEGEGREFQHRNQGLVLAFLMGAVFIGGPAALFYWIFFG